jgi:ABC-type tungstate transport system permease subunit
MGGYRCVRAVKGNLRALDKRAIVRWFHLFTFFAAPSEGDPLLINRCDVIELNPRRHRVTKLDMAKIFEDWLVSSQGHKLSARTK